MYLLPATFFMTLPCIGTALYCMDPFSKRLRSAKAAIVEDALTEGHSPVHRSATKQLASERVPYLIASSVCT